MNQLLIVNKAKAINAGATTPNDLSTLQEGAIAFFELGESSFLSAYPTKNFGIALGRGANKPAFVIPEVDIDTLEIVKATPAVGAKFSATFTFPTPIVGKEYTVILVKKGIVPTERNLFTTNIVAKTTTASTEAAALVKYIKNKTNDTFNVTASNSGAAVTITAQDDADYEIKFADGLEGVTTSSKTAAKKAIGDKAYIQALTQKCAAGKGFNLLDGESRDIYPGYPEAVEDLVPNGSGTEGYAIYNLHFATGRKSGKQVDERVWQYVYIAVPVSGTGYSAIDAVLTEAEESNASDDEQGNG